MIAKIGVRNYTYLGTITSGDVLNIMLIINDEFYQRASETFNPRNAVFISKNDGMFNNATNHQRDTIINTHTM